ncbi:postreplication repair E3 ubiquitin-protein ligase RAD18-like [Chrysoperla carnea]|uniref:postreplication repair E3 ubiquitin-protein ligase RAD18-like n=1 Tax=Chrysoperla carnea TaxID=189513 RepID=UPI001D077183|nr:postreplication repair E3 ubiquitin-protein ligase RAD18-like [Chrysoperla carnea]
MLIIRQIVETAKSALFICSICQESIKNPEILPCNHSFCAICLKNYLCSSPVKNNKLVNCPNCSKAVTRRSAYSAPDIEGQLFQDLITLLEAETGVDQTLNHIESKATVKRNIKVGNRKRRLSIAKNDKLLDTETDDDVLTDVCRTDVPLTENNLKTKKSTKNVKQLSNPKIHNEKPTKPTKSANRKRTLSGSEKNSITKRKKGEIENVENKDLSSDTKKNLVNNVDSEESSLKKKKVSTKASRTECDVESSEISKSNQTGNFEKANKNTDSNSPSSIHPFEDMNTKNIRTYERKYKPINNLTASVIDSEDALDSVQKVEQWLEDLPSDTLKRSKSLTPIKKSKNGRPKNKSLNEIGTKSTTEIARNLESEVLNDLLQLAVPKSNSIKDNWTRVKKEFRTPKFKKLDLSTVKPSNRKSGGNKKPSKQSDIICIDDKNSKDSNIMNKLVQK